MGLYAFDVMPNGQGYGVSPTKQAVKDYVCLATACQSVEMVEEFETLRARHICQGTKVIQILEKRLIPVPTTRGMINVEVFLCNYCGKLIINRSSMEIY